MSRKIIPWVDITCSRCGCLADGSGYYYRGIIAELKRNTKDWIIDDLWGTICPKCKREIEEENEN